MIYYAIVSWDRRFSVQTGREEAVRQADSLPPPWWVYEMEEIHEDGYGGQSHAIIRGLVAHRSASTARTP